MGLKSANDDGVAIYLAPKVQMNNNGRGERHGS